MSYHRQKSLIFSFFKCTVDEFNGDKISLKLTEYDPVTRSEEGFGFDRVLNQEDFKMLADFLNSYSQNYVVIAKDERR